MEPYYHEKMIITHAMQNTVVEPLNFNELSLKRRKLNHHGRMSIFKTSTALYDYFAV